MTPDDRYYITGEVPETPEPAEQPAPWTSPTVVGRRLPRIDAYERVSGAATYTADVLLPGMLYGAILRCPHAHATVKKVDTTKAEKMPGVVAILTDQTPGANIPWFNTRAGALSRLLDPHCRYEGRKSRPWPPRHRTRRGMPSARSSSSTTCCHLWGTPRTR